MQSVWYFVVDSHRLLTVKHVYFIDIRRILTSRYMSRLLFADFCSQTCTSRWIFADYLQSVIYFWIVDTDSLRSNTINYFLMDIHWYYTMKHVFLDSIDIYWLIIIEEVFLLAYIPINYNRSDISRWILTVLCSLPVCYQGAVMVFYLFLR